MTGKRLKDGLFQIAFVTSDIERSVRAFGRTHDIGGWLLNQNVRLDLMTLRGRPCVAAFRIALAVRGDTMFEFIEPLDAVPSVYRKESTNELLTGFHHSARAVLDLEEAVARHAELGYSVASEIRVGPLSVVYLENAAAETGMIELFQAGPALEEFIESLAALEAPVVDGEVRIVRI